MSCFSPIKAWFGPRNENGKYPLVFNPKDASIGGHPISQVEVPCGYCVGCRIDRSRAWAIRCVHEASLHDLNCFVTLTYAVAPKNNSLVKKDLQDFWKRLRKSIFPLTLRYFACGEYGSKGDRPHYHACIFGWRPHDLVTFGSHYSSEFLARVWGHGFVTVGDVTHASAAYVAQYVIKKQYGPDVDYGEREPEYVVMSRRPGIASDWIFHNLDDVYGYHDAVLSPDEKTFAVRYSDKNSPWELYTMPNVLNSTKTRITHSTTKQFDAYNWREPEVITFKGSDGKDVYARLYNPTGNKNQAC